MSRTTKFWWGCIGLFALFAVKGNIEVASTWLAAAIVIDALGVPKP